MELEIWMTILFGILTIGGIFASYYFAVKSKLRSAVENAIVSAEELDAVGEEKMAAAVEAVYSIVPVALKPFFSKAVVQTLVQTAFDKIQDFAVLQEKKKATKEESDKEVK